MSLPHPIERKIDKYLKWFDSNIKDLGKKML